MSVCIEGERYDWNRYSAAFCLSSQPSQLYRHLSLSLSVCLYYSLALYAISLRVLRYSIQLSVACHSHFTIPLYSTFTSFRTQSFDLWHMQLFLMFSLVVVAVSLPPSPSPVSVVVAVMFCNYFKCQQQQQPQQLNQQQPPTTHTPTHTHTLAHHANKYIDTHTPPPPPARSKTKARYTLLHKLVIHLQIQLLRNAGAAAQGGLTASDYR